MTSTVEFEAVYVMDFESLEGMTASRTPKECEVTDEAATEKSAALYWLVLGAFEVGTEVFMIAGILPRLAADLSAVGHAPLPTPIQRRLS